MTAKNISGRPWKDVGEKSSSKIKGNVSKLGWDARQKLRERAAIVKTLEKESKAAVSIEKEVLMYFKK